MAFLQVYNTVHSARFQRRLTVALVEHCRYQLQRTTLEQGEASNQHEWKKSLARMVLSRISNHAEVAKIAIYLLGPIAHDTVVDESAIADQQLMSLVELKFKELGDSPYPAPAQE